jgi:voltage-gated potassium channel
MTDVEPVRLERNELRLAAWERRMNPIIVVAAIVPIVIAFTPRGDDTGANVVNVASWLVFVVDFVVHLRLRPRYLTSRLGVFDAVIVVLTAPWYLIPGFSSSKVLGVARVGRLARVFVVSVKSPVLVRLGQRLGQAAIYSVALIAACAYVVERVEPPSAGFDDYGDSLWWAVVTFTTVGYGDLVPETAEGRVVGVILMIGGIALIGALAATLGSYLRSSEPTVADDPPLDTSSALHADVAALRTEIAALRDELAARPGESPSRFD